MRPTTRHLQREQLDKRLKSLRAVNLRRPAVGWIRAIREALGMSGRQLADRMGVANSHRMKLEKGEVSGIATMRSLQRAAEAMDCDFVYAFVPKNRASLEELVHQQAERAARRVLDEVGTTMALEAQPIDDSFKKREIDRIAKQLIDAMPRNLWDR
jgi:predicted DNA-binding mobile mystery protein A